jgi:hypothetical protein
MVEEERLRKEDSGGNTPGGNAVSEENYDIVRIGTKLFDNGDANGLQK